MNLFNSIYILSSFGGLPTDLVLVLLALVFSIMVSCVLMPWMLSICYRFRLFDNVNSRKLHKMNIPRMGGVIFIPSVAVAVLLTLSMREWIDPVSEYGILHQSSLMIGLGVLLLYFVGVIDDVAEISATIKFFVQFIVASVFPLAGLYLNSLYGFMGIYEIPIWLGVILTMIITMLIINAFNLIDGIDGLAASLAVFTLSVYGGLFYYLHMTLYCICIAALIGTLLVYLPFNLWGSTERHTKTFMGDSGSLILGVVIAYFTIKYAMDDVPVLPHRPSGLLVAFSAVIVPCFDLCRVALCRLRRGRGIFEADKTHLHHKFLAKGFSMHPTCVCIFLIQLFFFALNVLLFHLQMSIAAILLVDVLLFTALNIWLPTEHEEAEANEVITEDSNECIAGEHLPKISIITATYNSASTVRDTLESILHQTYQNYEVVVVDGLSNDNTMNIVREYVDCFNGRLIYKSEPDRGLYEAMNKGYMMATGDVVGILNSDDFFSSERVLERVAAALSNNEVDAVYGDVHYVDTCSIQQVTRYYSSRAFRPWLMRLGFMPAHPSFYCRRSIILAKGMFNLKYRVAADFDQIFRLIYKEGLKTQYLHLDFVTMREGGVSNSNLTSRMTIMNEHKDILSNEGLFTNTFLLSLRYIYKLLEIMISPYMPNPKLPAYVLRPTEDK